MFLVLACSNEDNVPEENSTDTTLETEEDSGLTEAMEIGLNNDISYDGHGTAGYKPDILASQRCQRTGHAERWRSREDTPGTDVGSGL